MSGLVPVIDEGITHHENSNIADAHRAGAITAFAITAHIAFLNLQVTGWVLILTGVAGAIISRSSRLRRTLVAKGRPGAASAGGTGRRPPPSPRPAPGVERRSGFRCRGLLAAAPDATPAKRETIEEYAGA